jgi:signal transduction histidine kinase
MRVAVRLTATTAVTGLLLFGGYGAWLLREEQRDLHAAVRRELTFLGTSLRVGVENALRDRQLADVEEATLRLEGLDTNVDVFVFDTQGAPVVAPGGMPAEDVRAALAALVGDAARSVETRTVEHPEHDAEHILLATPLLSDDGDALGVLAISRPLDDVNEDLLATSGAIAATVGSFVLLAMLFGLLIGQTRLAGPLARLAGGMRRVREGNLADAVPEAGDDEIVAVAREFNLMLRDLRDARLTAARAAEASREALRSLEVADRLVTVGQLSAAVAHEIGSPLQVLLGRARVLGERADDPERVRHNAGVLVAEAERITRIVSQFLALTRRRPVRREEVDLRALVGDVLALLDVESRRADMRLHLDEGHAELVAADPDQLRQVVLNLVRNAIAAGKRGGSVTVAVRGDAGACEVAVADDGAGMSAEVQARAFEPLFTTRADLGGAGLGLAVVRRIVDEHGGAVTLSSTEGKGSRFVVTLPREARS